MNMSGGPGKKWLSKFVYAPCQAHEKAFIRKQRASADMKISSPEFISPKRYSSVTLTTRIFQCYPRKNAFRSAAAEAAML